MKSMDEIQIDSTIEDVESTTAQYIRDHYLLLALLALIVPSVLDLWMLFGLGVDDLRLYVFPWILPMLGYVAVRSRIQSVFMRQFAHANSFVFRGKDYVRNSDAVLFCRGKSRMVQNAVLGTWRGRNLRVYNYIAQRSGYHRNQKLVSRTVLEFTFKVSFPHIFLDAHGRPSEPKLTSGRIKGLERIQLESNEFNNRFTLHAEKGNQIEALQIISPSFMQYLLDRHKAFDIEILDKTVYLAVNGVISTKARLNEAFDASRHLLENIERELERISK